MFKIIVRLLLSWSELEEETEHSPSTTTPRLRDGERSHPPVEADQNKYNDSPLCEDHSQ